MFQLSRQQQPPSPCPCAEGNVPRARLSLPSAGGPGSSCLGAGPWMVAGRVTKLLGQRLVLKQMCLSSSREKVTGLFCIIL